MDKATEESKHLTGDQLVILIYLRQRYERLLAEQQRVAALIKDLMAEFRVFIQTCAKELNVPVGWRYEDSLKAFIPPEEEEKQETVE